MKNNFYIIIPAFNEKNVIREVLEEILKEGYKNIIVVDDGSGDGTGELAFQTGVIVLRHKINRGKGAAIKTGIEAAKQLNADVIITFDADGQHDPKDIKKMLVLIKKGYDVILGSRFLKRQKIPLIKRTGNMVANLITYAFYGIWVTDSQSGLRAYSKRAFTSINSESDRYEFDTQVLRDIKKNHLLYKEIPMHVRYTAYSQNKQNRQNIVSAILTMIKVIFSA